LIVAGPLALDLIGRIAGASGGARATMLVGVIFLIGAAAALTRVDPRRREGEENVQTPGPEAPAPFPIAG
ncbi:MAG: hypothetical protein M3406_12095, partial [Chloroflexota bacterium]|nr:hypothetical protein [Chloroflexota bacterium]